MNSYNCIKCDYNTEYLQNYNRHLKTKRHVKVMINIICERCKKIFKRKLHLQQHLKKKKICTIKKSTIYSKIPPNYLKTAPKCTKTAPKLHQNPPKTLQNTQKYECEYCEKIFSRKYSMIRHIKSRCKNKSNISTNNTNNTFNINLNNTTNNINNINNIQINNYGNENIEYLKDLIDVIKGHEDNMLCFLKFLQLKHMNPEHKENWNIQYPTLKDNYSFVKSKDGWESQIIDDIVNINFKKGQEELEELFNNKAIELGNIDKYGVFLPEKEKKILDKIDKQIYEATPQNIKVHKNAIKKHKSDLYYHLKNYKSFFKK